MAKGKGARVKWGSEDSSPAHSSADDDGDDYIREASEDMSDEDSEKIVAFGLESDSEESPTKRGAKKRKGENQKARVPKKKRESEDLTMVLHMLKEQQVETSKISKGFAKLTSEVDTMRASREVKTSTVRTRNKRSKHIKDDSESDDNEVKETIMEDINKESIDENKKTDKGAPEDGSNHQDNMPSIEDKVGGESTPIESAKTEHKKKGGKETKKAQKEMNRPQLNRPKMNTIRMTGRSGVGLTYPKKKKKSINNIYSPFVPMMKRSMWLAFLNLKCKSRHRKN